MKAEENIFIYKRCNESYWRGRRKDYLRTKLSQPRKKTKVKIPATEKPC